MSAPDLVVRNGHLATLSPERSGRWGQIRDGLLVVSGGRIRWMGRAEEVPEGVLEDGAEVIDAGGGWVTPGLIDVHTHLVFGGQRVDEFHQRLRGASYEEIARQGGGIHSTVRATRRMDEEALEGQAVARIEAMVDEGVTTVEIKSGYGLDVDTELRMLRVAGAAADRAGIDVSRTLLGAHALPPEYTGERAAYLRLVREEMIPRAVDEGLAEAVDAFCESIAFSVDECAAVLEAGARHGLGVRLHADQLSNGGGAALAARLGARSADHLEYCSEEGAVAMSRAGTTAVLLPGAYYVLRESNPPPIDRFRALGVPMAVATDLNPGTSPLLSPLMAMNLACVQWRLTAEEALRGMTVEAAPVLGLTDRGRLESGLRADLAVWDVSDPSELAYWIGANPCRAVVSGGRRIR